MHYLKPMLCLLAAASGAAVLNFGHSFGDPGVATQEEKRTELNSMPLPIIAILDGPSWRYDESGVHGAHEKALGALSGTRWKATDDLEPTHLTLYDITSNVASRVDFGSEQSILHQLSPSGGRPAQYCKPLLSSTHPSTTPQQLPGKHLLAVWVAVELGKKEMFVDWYEGEHMPMLEKVPGWLCGRLYTISGDDSLGVHPEGRPEYHFLALHQFSEGGFMETKELKASQNTPWMEKVVEHITGKDLRLFERDIVYERITSRL
ncbi:uncharacterized protein SCHCODRAFT_01154339 [Schizophyllum commune H4-8]|nr:uncharacterized protein SCHCODRAFT_01154339 [Schizophyllum commune H4-8]KAI5891404.1 hypothetical protein SCHCODRAFT_01154339 [Schizophyllum commune H4-8]